MNRAGQCPKNSHRASGHVVTGHFHTLLFVSPPLSRCHTLLKPKYFQLARHSSVVCYTSERATPGNNDPDNIWKNGLNLKISHSDFCY